MTPRRVSRRQKKKRGEKKRSFVSLRQSCRQRRRGFAAASFAVAVAADTFVVAALAAAGAAASAAAASHRLCESGRERLRQGAGGRSPLPTTTTTSELGFRRDPSADRQTRESSTAGQLGLPKYTSLSITGNPGERGA